MYRIPCVLALACLSPALAHAQPQERAKFLAPFLDEQTVLVVRLDTTRINVTEAAQKLKPFVMGFEEEATQAQKSAAQWLQAFRNAGGRELYFLLSLDSFPNGTETIILPLTPEMQVEKLGMLLRLSGQSGSKVLHNALVIADKKELERIAANKSAPRPETTDAFIAAGEGAFQVLLLPPPHAKRVIEENMPTLPKELGGGSSKVLTEGIRWAALTADITPEIKLTMTVQAQDAAAAGRLRAFWTTALHHLERAPGIRQRVPQFSEFAATLSPEVQDSRLTIRLDIPRLTKVWQDALPRIRRQADTLISTNNLKQLAIAFHNYHGDYDKLPPHAIYSNPAQKDGKPLLSWRVLILPYIEHDNLYKQFKLDEPWDSEHNKKLIPLMPKIFMVPGTKPPPGHTYYQVIVTPKDYKGKYETAFAAFSGPDARRTLGQMTVRDGTSNTLMIVETSQAVPWTKPADVELPPDDKPLPVFGARPDAKSFPAAWGDGSVRHIFKTLPNRKLHERLLRQIIGWNDGEHQDTNDIIDNGEK